MDGSHPVIKWGAIIVFLVVNFLILASFVVASAGSDITTNANLYKGASFVFGLVALWLAHRRNNFWILLAFTALQWFTFTRVTDMLNAAS